MNILQFFHRKQTLPPFNIGDTVRLKKGEAWEDVRKLYNKCYPNCYTSYDDWHIGFKIHLEFYLGTGTHIVTKITEGTPAAGGWFVYVDHKDTGWHGNIFEKA